MAIARKDSRRIVVHNLTYRWKVRRRPTYDQGFASPILFVVELADRPASKLLVTLQAARPDNWLGAERDVVTPALVAGHVADARAAGGSLLVQGRPSRSPWLRRPADPGSGAGLRHDSSDRAQHLKQRQSLSSAAESDGAGVARAKRPADRYVATGDVWGSRA